MKKNLFLEPLVASIGILLFGFISIPVTAYLSGAHVSMKQGMMMSFIFFFLRYFWLLSVRIWFSK